MPSNRFDANQLTLLSQRGTGGICRGFPLFQRGIEGDFALRAWTVLGEIPPNLPLKKGGVSAPAALSANANSALIKGGEGHAQ